MKINVKRFFAVQVCIIAIGASVTQPIQAQTSSTKPSAQKLLTAALETGRAEKKNIMVHFTASWCGWCKRLDAFLHAPEVGKLMTENYVLLELTVQESPKKKALENPGADALMKEMGGDDAGLPFYFFLDTNGKKICDSLVMPGGKNIGHPASPEEIKAFATLLEKSAPRLTAANRSQIVDYLTKNAPHQ